MTVAGNENQTAKKASKISLRTAARILGVDPGHLCHVLKGERESQSLKRRYDELMKNPRFSVPDAESGPPDKVVFDAADDNTVHEWAATIAKLGFAIVCVQVRMDGKVALDAELGEFVGVELSQAELGHWDSTQWQPRVRHFFYTDSKRLADALGLIKSALVRRGALAHAAIAHYDVSASLWRGFYPEIQS